ncbi:unnamed protein product [Camellia sinensis]
MYCMVLFAGIVAEALVYGEAEGGENNENLFRSVCIILEPPLSVAQEAMKDLIGNAQEITPVMLDYKIHAENNSLYNTPPCYGIYMCGLVFEDLLAQGGLVEVEKKNMKKAQILYGTIDQSNGFYRCPVEKSVRSLMNVPFTLEKSEMEAEIPSPKV